MKGKKAVRAGEMNRMVDGRTLMNRRDARDKGKKGK